LGGRESNQKKEKINHQWFYQKETRGRGGGKGFRGRGGEGGKPRPGLGGGGKKRTGDDKNNWSPARVNYESEKKKKLKEGKEKKKRRSLVLPYPGWKKGEVVQKGEVGFMQPEKETPGKGEKFGCGMGKGGGGGRVGGGGKKGGYSQKTGRGPGEKRGRVGEDGEARIRKKLKK